MLAVHQGQTEKDQNNQKQFTQNRHHESKMLPRRTKLGCEELKKMGGSKFFVCPFAVRWRVSI